ncbi:hypothetical protein E2C01_090848 [Portunus trituberculatus]|uniref:Uncharacterized protein n=1 Tax=Portunus trituberculatus TaxID=210409 RepID=A0A5B7JLF8_PORTR|nr:hypothetical protein [Portunus trituberculatus]
MVSNQTCEKSVNVELGDEKSWRDIYMNVQRAQYPPVGIGGPGGSPAAGMQRPAGGPGQPYSGGMVRPPLSQTPGSKRPASSGSSKR